MPLTNAGRNHLVALLTNTSTIHFDNANSHIVVGDGNAAFNASQTQLQGANTARKQVESGFPLVQDNQVKFKAIFDKTEANFAWNEWGLINQASGGTLLNRQVEYNGTKLNGQTWIMEVTIEVVTN